MSEYTPTVEEARHTFATWMNYGSVTKSLYSLDYGEAGEAFDRMIQAVRAKEREWVADMIRAEAEDTSDGFGFDAYINGLCRAEEIAREKER